MFTILVADDNQLIVTKKERIMQKSKLVDDLRFLVRPTYKGYNMEDCTVTMLYCLPESRKAVSETLTKSDEMMILSFYRRTLTVLLPLFLRPVPLAKSLFLTQLPGR